MSFVSLWRISSDTPAYTADDLSGKGAELTGGRWNTPGCPLLYTSTSRALACLETLAHLQAGTLPLNRYLVELQVPQDSWIDAESVSASELVGWDAHPPGRVSLSWGSSWAATSRTLLAKVPSIVVPEEFNVLVNPKHPDIDKVVAVKHRKWLYDHRLKKDPSW